MKKIMIVITILLININLAACSILGSENKVKVIRREKPEDKPVIEMNFLSDGSLCDASTDGKEILLYRKSGLNNDCYLYTMDLTNGKCIKLTQLDGIIGYRAEYSPNGEKIAVSALNRDIKRYLPGFIIDRKNSEIKRIVCNKDSVISEDAVMNWSKDGNYIAVDGWNAVSDRIIIFNGEGKEVGCIDESLPDGNNIEQMPFGRQTIFFFDESRIIYNQGENIVYKKIDEPDALPVNMVKGHRFVVSPDRKHMAYVNKQEGSRFHIKIDQLGENMSALYTVAEFDTISVSAIFDWSPDSKNITYFSDNSIWNLNIQTKAVKQLTKGLGIVNKLCWVDNNSFLFGTLKNEKDVIYQVKFENHLKSEKPVSDCMDISRLNNQLRKLQSESENEYNPGIIEINASSTLNGDYGTANLIDRNFKTAWVEGTDGTGEGQYIELELKDIALNRVGIINGYKKSDYIYTANSRIKKIKVEVDTIVKNIETGKVEKTDHTEKITGLLDRGYYDEDIDLLLHYTDFKPVAKNRIRIATKIRLTILEVYKGSKYEDTCISEVIIKYKKL